MKAPAAVSGARVSTSSVARSSRLAASKALAGSYLPGAGIYDDEIGGFVVIPGSNPPRLDPNRFGLMFESSRFFPGTLEDQAAIRANMQIVGDQALYSGRLLWYLARTYKKFWDDAHGAGARHHVLVLISGTANTVTDVTISLAENQSGSDLVLLFWHEVGHIFDRYILTPAARQALMDGIGNPTGGDWRALDFPYFDRPEELFAWGFQRLILPELTPHTFTAEAIKAVIPDADAIWREVRGG